MPANTRSILALELSQRPGSIAVRNSSGDTVARNVASGKRDDDDVMPSIESMMTGLDLQPSDLALIIVSVGPGGFTGLRTATAIAKMISFATGAHIIPVPSAIVVAASSGGSDGPFLVVSSVKKEEYWLSRVQRKDGEWSCVAGLSNPAELPQKTDGVIRVFADEYLPTSARNFFKENNISVGESSVSALLLLEVGLQFEASGQTVTPLGLQPVYPREPEAVRIWNTGQPKE
jgi:tRNA threonylcarbamoyl adenosine modification protein YeaZ